MFKLVDYQSKAVEKIVTGFKELIYSGNDKTQMIFKSPTGSGKTLMMAATLDEILSEPMDNEFVYIWASMGDLHTQSFNKLKDQYLPDSDFNMILLENMTSGALPANTILFCNWESMYQIKKETDDNGNEINVFKNQYVRIGEQGRNLQEVLTKTRADGRKIILIVDEAHRTYLGENSQKLVAEVIQPNMTIEVSATPKLMLSDGYYEENIGRYISVKMTDVIASGLIKNKTIINNDIVGEINTVSADELVLEAALRQRSILEAKYIKQGTDIKPLVLIQLPTENKDANIDESMRTLVEDYMNKNGISYSNQKLAIWLSGDKTNKELVDKQDSPVEVLIFKQAIATGWDCPRAQILVMLRDIKSVIFEIQTVGRILRMPELKHYEDDDLNSAYVFTNIRDISVDNDTDAQTYFRSYKSKLPDNFKNITLPNSSYSIRRDRQRLGGNFRSIFINKMDEYFGIKFGDSIKDRLKKLDAKLQIKQDELKIPILSNIVLESLDNIDKTLWESNIANVRADAPYIQRTFNTLLKAWVAPYAPHDSIPVLRTAIYKWFWENGFTDEGEVQRILTCSNEDAIDGSQRQLNAILYQAKKEFGKQDGESREWFDNIFHIPSEIEFGEEYTLVNMQKHALQPYYRSKTVSKPELTFESLLDTNKNVEWWFRNGVGEPKYFAVKYELLNQKTGFIETHGFYPDYIVKFNDGRIGIFDTKSGKTATDNETKAKLTALKKYIDEHNGLNLFGGIIDVVDTDKKIMQLQQCPDTAWKAFIL